MAETHGDPGGRELIGGRDAKGVGPVAGGVVPELRVVVVVRVVPAPLVAGSTTAAAAAEVVDVVVACPPRGREDALCLGQGVPEAHMPLFGEEDEGRDDDGHGHDAECPGDPQRVVYRQEFGFGDVVQHDGPARAKDSDEGHGQGKAERRGPPIQRVEVEHLGNPHECCEIVKAVVHKDKEPKVDLNLGLAVAGGLVPPGRIATGTTASR